ncbi:MAG: Asp-tRNA(Asn)/Glu-tRNA(Gln) amidotransferase subunit GatA, partial [Chloroflexota bacterium]|nr:Asp-tRNA(Asn)/Glu-tRNA(Gln) amidotransferase subunit GatA [Chloroflexota bacterium]
MTDPTTPSSHGVPAAPPTGPASGRDDLTTLTAAGARRLLDAREVSAVEVTEAHLARIAAVDDRVRAY